MKIIKQQILATVCVGALVLPVAGAHAEADKHARNLSASCAACHGTDGRSAGGMPILAGMDKGLFVTAMKDFKSGARPATVMHHHAKGYSDSEFEKLAEFFAAQKR
ncbi:MAG: c-type cytochrome [Gallionella sp.]